MERKFVFNIEVMIPADRIADVKELNRFIREEIGIDISLMDTYNLWLAISDDWFAGWLDINAHYDDMTREEYLEYCMKKFGFIIED